MYYTKYLKYKQKYLNLIGGVDENSEYFSPELTLVVKPVNSDINSQSIPHIKYNIRDQYIAIHMLFKGETRTDVPESHDIIQPRYKTQIFTLNEEDLARLGFKQFNYFKTTDLPLHPIIITDIEIQKYLFKLSSIYFIETIYRLNFPIKNAILTLFNNEFERLFPENSPCQIINNQTINPILLR
jgi:hypothetical protein